MSLTFDELEPSLRELFPDLGDIEDITIDEWDDAGLAQNVRILDSHGETYRMTAHDFRLRFYSIRSLCSTFSTKDRVLYAQGKGFGHHIGLCMWGAYYMALDGYSYKEILTYYYPGTDLIQL